MLLPNGVNDFTQLLCASGKAGDFQHDDGSVIDHVEAEELGGSDGGIGSGNEGRSSGSHDVVLSGSFGLGGRSQPLFLF